MCWVGVQLVPGLGARWERNDHARQESLQNTAGVCFNTEIRKLKTKKVIKLACELSCGSWVSSQARARDPRDRGSLRRGRSTAKDSYKYNVT